MRKYTRHEYEEYEEYEEQQESEMTEGGLFAPIAGIVFGIIVIALLCCIFLFEVKYVVVEGNIHYTDEEIKTMVLDDWVSANSILVSFVKNDEKIENVPFLDSIQIDYMSRNTIRIRVNEKFIVGYVEQDQKYWYFDQDGIVVENAAGLVMTAEERIMLSESQSEEIAGDGESEMQDSIVAVEAEMPVKNYVPLVKGLEFGSVEVGEELKVKNSKVFNTLASLNQMINKDDIPPKYVYFDEDSNLFLFYENIEVRLGQDENLENKMSTLAAIMPKIEDMSGTLLLENYSSIQSGVIFQKNEE